MEANYIINIGEVLDVESNLIRPKQTLIISNEQFEVIKQFANTEKDADLNTVYIINDFKFKVIPEFKINEIDNNNDTDIGNTDKIINKCGCIFSRYESKDFDNILREYLASGNCKGVTYKGVKYEVGDRINVLCCANNNIYIKSFEIKENDSIIVNWELGDTPNKYVIYSFGNCFINNIKKA